MRLAEFPRSLPATKQEVKDLFTKIHTCQTKLRRSLSLLLMTTALGTGCNSSQEKANTSSTPRGADCSVNISETAEAIPDTPPVDAGTGKIDAGKTTKPKVVETPPDAGQVKADEGKTKIKNEPVCAKSVFPNIKKDSEPSNVSKLTLKDIEKAKELLYQEPLNKSFLAAAVKSPKKNEFEIVHFANMSGKVTPSKDGGFVLKRIGRKNGINTAYDVTVPEGWALVGIRSKNPSSLAQKSINDEVVYIPYSKAINNLEIRKAGLRYLDSLIRFAAKELNYVNSKIKDPHSNQETSVENIEKIIGIQSHIVLAIIEHMDDSLIKDGVSTFREQYEKSLATIGANPDIAFNWSGLGGQSARGLFQLMPYTYPVIVKTFPLAMLEEDFIEGTTDHLNAAKASILHSNRDLTYLNSSFRSWLFQKENQWLLRALLSVGYNAGPGRLDNFEQKPETFQNWCWMSKLPKETQIYLQKAVVVNEYLNQGKI